MSDFNVVKSKPSLKDVLNDFRQEIMLSLNCHALATVRMFNPLNQTVTAQMNYTKTYVQVLQNGRTEEKQVSYPLLVDMPVVSLCGGSTALTFPITAGDQCIVLFNDRDMDNWFQSRALTSGPPAGVATNRVHSFSDGIALVGLNAQSTYDTIRALLSNGTVKLGINPLTNKVTLENSVVSLKDALLALTTALTTFATGLTPVNVVAKAAQLVLDINTPVTGVDAKIGAILE